MRFSQYKLIYDLCGSLYATAAQFSEDRSWQWILECQEGVRAIERFLYTNRDSVRSDVVFDSISDLDAELREYSVENLQDVDIQRLSELIVSLSEACRLHLEYKYKVVFFAELSSKWDSMESVYHALMKRDDCEVDVVLEPVFQSVQLEDGTTKQEVIYDDYLTAMGIRHIPYQNYDMEKIRPDITFISQPYEGVTLPMFWSENISRYSKLVYLPYYCLTLFNSAYQPDFYSHFEHPTEKHAWKIICQSEVMKKYYEIYGSRKGENVIPCGLPKWDYVMQLNQENTPCPPEWKKKLEGRKVFLFNTHPSGVTSDVHYWKKTLEIFHNNKKTALIWRPHPMMESVLKIHMPDLFAELNNMKDFIRKSDNMIFDDSKYYGTSFVWSDALISDYSSIINLYLFMEKPVLMHTRTDIEKAGETFYSSNQLFDYSRIPFAHTIEEQQVFIDSVCSGNDVWKKDREYLLKKYMEHADGKVGERVAEAILNAFESEFGVPAPEGIETSGEIVLIGSREDSLPCIRHLMQDGEDFLVCDEFWDTDDYTRISITELQDRPLRAVVVTSKYGIDAIVRNLTANYRIPEHKIVAFWKIYQACLPPMVCDRIMQNPKYNDCTGMIIGLSHTEVGIVLSKLKEKFFNLSVSSQDLYFQLQTIRHCMEMYPEKFRKLKYVVLDLYGYNYFNFDTSLSNSALKYLLFGGYHMDSHHFDENRNMGFSFERAMDYLNHKKFEGLTEEQLILYDELFPDILKYTNYEGYDSTFCDLSHRFRVVSDEDVNTYDYGSATRTKIFPETIKENILNFRSILDILYGLNPEMKIYTVIVPKYIETQLKEDEVIAKHRLYFNRIISDLQKEYPFEHVDFHMISDIAFERTNYHDSAHLNYLGALRFTEELNRVIW